MQQDLRRDIRHSSSQKAVLLAEGSHGSLCVITNLSNGGLCLAVVGSARPVAKDRIDLKVKDGKFFCNIVNKGKEGLHCRFDDLIDEPHMARMFSSYRATPRADEWRGGGAWLPPPALPLHSTYDRSGRWRASGVMSEHTIQGNRLTRIYSEGCFVGREQVDPAMEALDATVQVLNPYEASDERDHWALGFTDAVRHMAKYWPPSG